MLNHIWWNAVILLDYWLVHISFPLDSWFLIHCPNSELEERVLGNIHFVRSSWPLIVGYLWYNETRRVIINVHYHIFNLMPLPQTSSSLSSQLLLLVPWSVRWAYTFLIALLIQLHGNSFFIESVPIDHGRSLLIVYQIQYWCRVSVGVLEG